jgi:alpha-beta hydrolase superfamily lysophospholipase
VAAEIIIYQKDPLIHDKISVSLFHSLFHNGLHLTHLAKSAKIPVLVCHSDRDQITSKSGSELYVNNLGEKTEFKIWHSSFHEPHHDFEKERAMRFYVDWLKARIIK